MTCYLNAHKKMAQKKAWDEIRRHKGRCLQCKTHEVDDAVEPCAMGKQLIDKWENLLRGESAGA